MNKEILVEVENHCRRVKFTSRTEEDDYSSAMDATKALLASLFPGSLNPFFLQIFDKDYQRFIDLCQGDSIAHKSTVKVLWQTSDKSTTQQVCLIIVVTIIVYCVLFYSFQESASPGFTFTTVTASGTTDVIIRAPTVCLPECSGTFKQMKLQAGGDGRLDVVADKISDEVRQWQVFSCLGLSN